MSSIQDFLTIKIDYSNFWKYDTKDHLENRKKNRTNKQTNNHDLIFNIGFFKMRNIFRIERSNFESFAKLLPNIYLPLLLLLEDPLLLFC